MGNWLKERAEESELMDDFSIGGTELTHALRYIRMINRILGAAGPILSGVKMSWTQMGKPQKLSILDIGAGSGDINRLLLKWADRHRIELVITLIDISQEACEEAATFFSNESRVKVVRGDLFNLQSHSADIVTASQFLHHFPTEQIPTILSILLKTARAGIVISDLHRHPVAWIVIWIVTHLLPRNRYIRKDGPLSVAKGFRSSELESVSAYFGAENTSYWWKPMFRYLLVIRK